MTLTNPTAVLHHLRAAREKLSFAHAAAGETEGDQSDLNGPVRDAIYGINTTIDALYELIEESH